MDRHHLLALLDTLQEKYEFQDGEYKEFAEAIGGKKKPMEFKENDLVKVEYDHIETMVDIDEGDLIPKIIVHEKCSTIWKIIPDYTGEVKVVLFNHGHTDFQVNKGDRIAQLILEKCDTPAVVEIGLLEETERGSKGFGSTGVSE